MNHKKKEILKIVFRYRYKQLFAGACYMDVNDTSLLCKQQQIMVFLPKKIKF